MSAHRYWRVLVNAIQSGPYVSIVEMQMFEAGTATDSTGSGTASASSSYTAEGGTAAKAFDNVLSYPGWTNNGDGAGCWLAYDFGVGVTKDIVLVSLLNRSDQWLYQIPSGFSIQWSDDASAWTTLFTVSSLTWTAGQTRYFNASGETSAPEGPFSTANVTVKKAAGYAILGGDAGVAAVQKAVGYAVLGAADNQVSVNKLVAFAVKDERVIRPQVFVT